MTPRSSRSRDPHDPWFRIGTVDFNTTNLITLVQVVGLFVVAAEGFYGPIMRQLPMFPDDVFHGQVWRVATWPFATTISFSTVVAIFFFWYFGNELERYLGRKRALTMYAGFTLVLAAVGLALSSFVPGFLYGLQVVELMVFLTWVLENPHARLIFNVPAWLFGVVIVGIQVLSYLADRYWFGLLSFVVGLYFCAVVAKSVGLLTDYKQVVSVNREHRRRKPSRPHHPPRGRGRGHTSGPTVVTGPWENVSKDQRELDALLDKISQHGVESLTEKDRARMMELRERIRRQG